MLNLTTIRTIAPITQERDSIYVASRASVPERGAKWRSLRDQGWPICSSWIDEDGEGQTADFSDLWARIETEVTTAAGLILYAEAADFPLKGAFLEVGMAIAAGVPVYVVLPDVVLEPRSMRPVGSWVAHPGVQIGPSVEWVLESFFHRRAEHALAPAARR